MMPKGTKLSDETKKKMSESNAHYWLEKKRSEQTREKMRQAHLGRKNRLGFVHTDESKEKLSFARRGKVMSEATKEKLRQYWIGQKSPLWKGGYSRKDYPLGWNRNHRELIRARDEYKCGMCGVHEIETNRRHAVHHIDYDKKNLSQKNLISLCLRCHAKTNHNRNYWYDFFARKGILCWSA